LSSTPPVEEKTRPNRSDPGYAPTQFIGDDSDNTDEAATIIADWAPDAVMTASSDAPQERKVKPRPESGRTHVIENGNTVAGKSTPRAKSRAAAPARQLPPLSMGLMIAAVILSTLVAIAWGWRNSATKTKSVPVVTLAALPVAAEPAAVLPSEPARDISNNAVATPSAPAAIPASAATLRPAVERNPARNTAKVEPHRRQRRPTPPPHLLPRKLSHPSLTPHPWCRQ
jgi:hypothetical protein